MGEIECFGSGVGVVSLAGNGSSSQRAIRGRVHEFFVGRGVGFVWRE
jgi:hypothetical protein